MKTRTRRVSLTDLFTPKPPVDCHRRVSWPQTTNSSPGRIGVRTHRTASKDGKLQRDEHRPCSSQDVVNSPASHVIDHCFFYLFNLSTLVMSFCFRLGRLLVSVCWTLSLVVISRLSARRIVSLIVISVPIGSLVIVVSFLRNGTVAAIFMAVLKAAGTWLIRLQWDGLKNIWDNGYCNSWPTMWGCQGVSNSSVTSLDSRATGSKFNFDFEIFMNGGSVNL